MSSAAQSRANRENATKSTGPRTAAGKAASSRNSLRHGLTSGKYLVADDDPAEFFELLDDLRAEHQPATPTQEILVERLAAAEWKMRRIRFFDAEIVNLRLAFEPLPPKYNQNGRTDPAAWAFHKDACYSNDFTKYARYESGLQREFSRCLRELRALQAATRQPDAIAVNAGPQPYTVAENAGPQSYAVAEKPTSQPDAIPAAAPPPPPPNPPPPKWPKKKNAKSLGG